MKKLAFLVAGGLACLQAWAMPTGVGLGTSLWKGEAAQGPAWIGIATGYWMPDGESPGLSVGGIFAVNAETNATKTHESRRATRIWELCPNDDGPHLVNGRQIRSATEANRQFQLKATCKQP